MNMKILLAFFLSFFISHAAVADIKADKKVLDYFNELVFGAELGEKNQRIKKWVGDMRIFVKGERVPFLDRELDNIIEEINAMITPIRLLRVASEEEANYIIFLGSGEDYAKIESAARAHIERNWGLFWVYFNGRNEIYKGSMYVDIIRAHRMDAQKHLLREELTQSLGIMNDSYRYADSMFYQKWNPVTRYSEIDKGVIKLLYQSQIKTNMTKQQVNQLITPTGFADVENPAQSPGDGGGWRNR